MVVGGFRGFTAAASLKRDPGEGERADGVRFRGFTAAASLKPAHESGWVGCPWSFRGFTAAASLKPPRARPGPGDSVAFPRLHRRGLIEAG